MVYKLNNGNGFVKEFNCFGKLEYEGVYENGERNGKGKEYDYNSRPEYEGSKGNILMMKEMEWEKNII